MITYEFDIKNVMYCVSVNIGKYANEIVHIGDFINVYDPEVKREKIKQMVKEKLNVDEIEEEMRKKYEFDSLKMRINTVIDGRTFVEFNLTGKDGINYDQLEKDIIDISLQNLKSHN